MKAYQTNNLGHYTGEVQCQKDPLTPGEYLLPMGATLVPPPSFKSNEIPVFDGTKWSIQPDFSGKEFYHKKTAELKYFEIGEMPTAEYTDIKPPNERFISFSNGKWAVDASAKKKHEDGARIAELKRNLAETDWVELPSAITRKGKDWVDKKIKDRMSWYEELKSLEN